MPKLSVTQRPTFSALFKFSGHVTNQGKMAKMKSITML